MMIENVVSAKYKAMGILCLLSIILLNVSLLAWTDTADAAIFKCVNANGEVSYNQTPCAPAQETAKVLPSSTSNSANVDCRIANNFARRTATVMRAGQSSGDVFDSYGGVDAMPRTSVGIVNYVFSHKGNVETGAQRIASLSAARCSAGAYGPVSCDDFPYNFVAELGGCEQAALSMVSRQMSGASNGAQANSNVNAQANTANTQALGARTMAADSSENCKQAVQAQVSSLLEQMRTSQTAETQERLNEQRIELSNQLASC